MSLKAFTSMVKAIAESSGIAPESVILPETIEEKLSRPAVETILGAYDSLPNSTKASVLVIISRCKLSGIQGKIDEELEMIELENKKELIHLKIWLFKATFIFLSVFIASGIAIAGITGAFELSYIFDNLSKITDVLMTIIKAS